MEDKEIPKEEIISELKLEIEDLKKQITYEDIAKANETIETTDIKGKDYAEVNQRIKAFRMVYPNGTIKPTMISNENGICIFKVEVYSERYTLLAVGHAYEKEGSTFINKTSYIENCETSAVGRALGMCGFGIDTSVASAEEVSNAIANQNEKQPTKKPTSAKKTTNDKKVSPSDFEQENMIDELQTQLIEKYAHDGLTNLDGILIQFKVDSLDKLKYEEAEQVIKVCQKRKEKIKKEKKEVF